MAKMYEVKLRISHDTGQYNRGNRRFTWTEQKQRIPQPQIIDESEIAGLIDDLFLEITELPDEAA